MSASNGESSSAINIQCENLREILKKLEEKRVMLSRAAEENLLIRCQLQLLCQKTFNYHLEYLQCAGTEASDYRDEIQLQKLIKENKNMEILIMEMCKIIAKICDESYRLLNLIQDDHPECFSDFEESEEYLMDEIEADSSEEDEEKEDDSFEDEEKED